MPTPETEHSDEQKHMNRPFSDELISAYLDGELTSEEQALVERTLVENVAARRMFEDLRSLRAGLQSLPQNRLDESFSDRVLRAAERAMLKSAAPAGPTVDRPQGVAGGGANDLTDRLKRWQRGFWIMSTVAAALLIMFALNFSAGRLNDAQHGRGLARADRESAPLPNALMFQASPAAPNDQEFDAGATPESNAFGVMADSADLTNRAEEAHLFEMPAAGDANAGATVSRGAMLRTEAGSTAAAGTGGGGGLGGLGGFGGSSRPGGMGGLGDAAGAPLRGGGGGFGGMPGTADPKNRNAPAPAVRAMKQSLAGEITAAERRKTDVLERTNQPTGTLGGPDSIAPTEAEQLAMRTGEHRSENRLAELGVLLIDVVPGNEVPQRLQHALVRPDLVVYRFASPDSFYKSAVNETAVADLGDGSEPESKDAKKLDSPTAAIRFVEQPSESAWQQIILVEGRRESITAALDDFVSESVLAEQRAAGKSLDKFAPSAQDGEVNGPEKTRREKKVAAAALAAQQPEMRSWFWQVVEPTSPNLDPQAADPQTAFAFFWNDYIAKAAKSTEEQPGAEPFAKQEHALGRNSSGAASPVDARKGDPGSAIDKRSDQRVASRARSRAEYSDSAAQQQGQPQSDQFRMVQPTELDLYAIKNARDRGLGRSSALAQSVVEKPVEPAAADADEGNRAGLPSLKPRAADRTGSDVVRLFVIVRAVPDRRLPSTAIEPAAENEKQAETPDLPSQPQP